METIQKIRKILDTLENLKAEKAYLLSKDTVVWFGAASFTGFRRAADFDVDEDITKLVVGEALVRVDYKIDKLHNICEKMAKVSGIEDD